MIRLALTFLKTMGACDILVDEFFMKRAIALAKLGWGNTHPNPLVGALIVENGSIVAEGFHAKSGEPHAERNALTNLGRKPNRDAVMYVTLEPCCTCGRTGACCDALIDSGISRVVVGATDPNPAHAGNGFTLLSQAGIDVQTGVLADECEDINLIFNHWIVHKTPFVAAKFASTLDGYIATGSGDSKWITGEAARDDVMKWRKYFPAIAVGKHTVMQDNPALTSRMKDATVCPRRLIWDAELELAKDASRYRVFSDTFASRTVVICKRNPVNESMVKHLESLGVAVWRLADAPYAALWQKCAEEGLTGIYVEGGANTHGQLLAANAIHYVFSYRAPVILGTLNGRRAMGNGKRVDKMAEAIRLTKVRQESFGDDQLMRGYIG